MFRSTCDLQACTTVLGGTAKHSAKISLNFRGNTKAVIDSIVTKSYSIPCHSQNAQARAGGYLTMNTLWRVILVLARIRVF